LNKTNKKCKRKRNEEVYFLEGEIQEAVNLDYDYSNLLSFEYFEK